MRGIIDIGRLSVVSSWSLFLHTGRICGRFIDETSIFIFSGLGHVFGERPLYLTSRVSPVEMDVY